MGSTGRVVRKRPRALLRVKHKRVYSFTRAQLLASFFLSFLWTILIGPKIELYGLPLVYTAMQEVQSVSSGSYVPGDAHSGQTAKESTVELLDPIDRVAQRIRSMNVKSNHLSLLTGAAARRA